MSQKVLITGAAKGLGNTLARHMASQGYTVFLHYFTSEADIHALAKDIGAAGVFQADLTKREDAERLAAAVGDIDILINTVGDFIFQPLRNTAPDAFRYCIENNLYSAWYMMSYVLDGMIARGHGNIINFGCVSCDQLTARENTTPYYIAKTSLLMLTRSLAKEIRNTGVRINMISPGVLPTGVSADKPDVPVVPFDAIAEAVTFLVDDKHTSITGANLEISAGWRPE